MTAGWKEGRVEVRGTCRHTHIYIQSFILSLPLTWLIDKFPAPDRMRTSLTHTLTGPDWF